MTTSEIQGNVKSVHQFKALVWIWVGTIWPVPAIFSYIKTENLTKNKQQVKPVRLHPPSTVWAFSWLWGSCFSWCFEVWVTQPFPSSWGSECACNRMSNPTKHKHGKCLWHVTSVLQCDSNSLLWIHKIHLKGNKSKPQRNFLYPTWRISFL